MVFSQSVRRFVTGVGIACPLIIGLGLATPVSAQIATAHVSHASAPTASPAASTPAAASAPTASPAASTPAAASAPTASPAASTPAAASAPTASPDASTPAAASAPTASPAASTPAAAPAGATTPADSGNAGTTTPQVSQRGKLSGLGLGNLLGSGELGANVNPDFGELLELGKLGLHTDNNLQRAFESELNGKTGLDLSGLIGLLGH